MYELGILLLLPMLIWSQEFPYYFQPEQVHVSYGAVPSQMTFTWLTFNYTEPSVVEYGLLEGPRFNLTASGKPAVKFTDGGIEKRTMYIHRVIVKNLQAGKTYGYHVGSPTSGWSEVFFFQAMHTKSDWQPTFAVFGDMGNVNAKSLPFLQEEVQKGKVDAILHVGDFAYDMHDDNARVGDAFMRQIQPVAAYIPYMVCPGNHEAMYNFSNYKNRFSMPSEDGHKMFWSLDIGKLHLLSINTEAYYPFEYGTPQQTQLQFDWLEQDLMKANENRDKAPWIVVIGHRPMYCSTNDATTVGPEKLCNNVDKNVVRVGLPQYGMPGLEDLFYKYGVDLQFYAHEHSYERLWPVYRKKVCNGTGSNPYDNSGGPVHIVTGAGGNEEGQTQFDPIPYPWSAFRSDDFGYTRMKIMNTTHLMLEQVSVDKGGKIIDSLTLVRNKHGQGMYNCH